MKYRIPYMLTRDIDWFACIDGKWVHAASVGGILPVAINDCSMLRVMQYVVANMKRVFQIDDLWINESYIDQRYRRHIDDYRENGISENDFRQNYEKSFVEMARKGFCSYIRGYDNETEDNCYYCIARPKRVEKYPQKICLIIQEIIKRDEVLLENYFSRYVDRLLSLSENDLGIKLLSDGTL